MPDYPQLSSDHAPQGTEELDDLLAIAKPLKKRKYKRHDNSPAMADICSDVKFCWMTTVVDSEQDTRLNREQRQSGSVQQSPA